LVADFAADFAVTFLTDFLAGAFLEALATFFAFFSFDFFVALMLISF
jgi:hypothetical protein